MPLIQVGLIIGLLVVVFGVAAWVGPKVIRAVFPEEQHEDMISKHRMMVIIAIVVGILGLMSGVPAFLANQ